MIKIVFGNGDQVKWNKGEYTDYKYDGKCFIIIKNDEWIAFYSIKHIISVIVKEENGDTQQNQPEVYGCKKHEPLQ